MNTYASGVDSPARSASLLVGMRRLCGLILAAVAVGVLATVATILLWPGRVGNGGPPEEASEPPLAVLRGGTGAIWGVAISPDGALGLHYQRP